MVSSSRASSPAVLDATTGSTASMIAATSRPQPGYLRVKRDDLIRTELLSDAISYDLTMERTPKQASFEAIDCNMFRTRAQIRNRMPDFAVVGRNKRLKISCYSRYSRQG